MIRRQPALEQFPGLSIQPARHYRSCVHIQPYTPGRLSNRTKLIVFGGPQGDPLAGRFDRKDVCSESRTVGIQSGEGSPGGFCIMFVSTTTTTAPI
jgi:hypothetical protein